MLVARCTWRTAHHEMDVIRVIFTSTTVLLASCSLGSSPSNVDHVPPPSPDTCDTAEDTDSHLNADTGADDMSLDDTTDGPEDIPGFDIESDTTMDPPDSDAPIDDVQDTSDAQDADAQAPCPDPWQPLPDPFGGSAAYHSPTVVVSDSGRLRVAWIAESEEPAQTHWALLDRRLQSIAQPVSLSSADTGSSVPQAVFSTGSFFLNWLEAPPAPGTVRTVVQATIDPLRADVSRADLFVPAVSDLELLGQGLGARLGGEGRSSTLTAIALWAGEDAGGLQCGGDNEHCLRLLVDGYPLVDADLARNKLAADLGVVVVISTGAEAYITLLGESDAPECPPTME